MLHPSRLLLAALPLLLTGCALQTTATFGPEVQHLTITGAVHGGQSPVVGAHVSILQGATNGTGGASYDLIGNKFGYGATASLPTGVTAGTPDYVTTDANGGFRITGDYLCSSGGPVYLLATQGNPGLGSGKSNPALAELAVVATDCSSTLSPTLQIGITEVSTVAGVYALAGFMTGPLNLSSSGSTNAINGIDNAGATALSLVNLPTGTALATTAAGATVPTARINLLADILAGCVNSDGTTTACSTLFANATNGTATPTDTVTALLNIAHNPTANIANLYGLATASAPYQPTSATQPTDLTLALTYPTIMDTSSDTVNPNLPSINATGAVVLAGEGQSLLSQTVFDVGGTVTVLNNLGAKVFSMRENSGTTSVVQPQIVAIDPSGNGWIANGALNATVGGQLLKINLATGTNTSYAGYGHNPTGITQSIVSDASGNIFIADNSSGEAIYEYSNSGQYQYTLLTGAHWTGVAVNSNGDVLGRATEGVGAVNVTTRSPYFNGTAGLNSAAFDSSNVLWVTLPASASIYKYPISENTSGGKNYPTAASFSGIGGAGYTASSQTVTPIVMDGASSAWVPNYAGTSISGFTNAGVALTPAATSTFAGGFQTGCPSKGVAVDNSGNIWVTCDIGSALTGTPLVEFIGTAVPVSTPILPGHLGVRP